jgi:hypothetical protein
LFIYPNHIIDKKFQEHPRWKSTILALAKTDAALTTDGQVKTRGLKKKNSGLEKGVQERIVAQAETGAQRDAEQMTSSLPIAALNPDNCGSPLRIKCSRSV